MTTEQKREELREKIEAGEQRQAERNLADQAREAAETAKDFVKEHPLATVAGAVAIGLAIGAMTKPGRRLARRGGLFATLLADAAIAYGMSAIDRASVAARNGQDALADLGDSIGETARDARRDAGYFASKAADRTATGSRRAVRSAGRTMRNLRERVTH